MWIVCPSRSNFLKVFTDPFWYSRSASCATGLVCWTKPGRLSGDHEVRAVGGRRLHIHIQHQAGETGGRLRENHSGSGEKTKSFCLK